MADIINLRRARKRKVRDEAAAEANVNRAVFGVAKGEKRQSALTQSRAERSLDGHRLEPEPGRRNRADDDNAGG